MWQHDYGYPPLTRWSLCIYLLFLQCYFFFFDCIYIYKILSIKMIIASPTWRQERTFSWRRRFDVVTTFLTSKQRCYNVNMTSCAYWLTSNCVANIWTAKVYRTCAGLGINNKPSNNPNPKTFRQLSGTKDKWFVLKGRRMPYYSYTPKKFLIKKQCILILAKIITKGSSRDKANNNSPCVYMFFFFFGQFCQ